jgi:hypothetical protein
MGRMKRIDVSKKGDQWVAEAGDKVVAKADRKVDAVRKTASEAKKMPEAVTVKIHKADGKIQQERTYPRAADPRKSKG